MKDALDTSFMRRIRFVVQFPFPDAVQRAEIWRRIGAVTLVAGALVGTLALVHLVLNYSLGGAWPPLPMKELAIGFLFAAGTFTSVGTKGTLALYDSSAALDLTFL